MPEARFDDLLTVIIRDAVTRKSIDRVYLDVCEPASIEAVGFVVSSPALVGIHIDLPAQAVIVTLAEVPILPITVTVHLSGLRRNSGPRFKRFTYDEMARNQRFWDQWKSS
jgi:hypothetical protein